VLIFDRTFVYLANFLSGTPIIKLTIIDFYFAEHNGKVLHLVQRLPVVTTASATTSTSTSTNAPPNSGSGGGGGFNPAQLVS